MMCFQDRTFCDAPCRNRACERMLTRQVVKDAHKWWRQFNSPGGAPIARSNFSEACPYYMPVTEGIDHRRTMNVVIETVPKEVCGSECHGLYHRTVEYDEDEYGRRRTMEQYKVYVNPCVAREETKA